MKDGLDMYEREQQFIDKRMGKKNSSIFDKIFYILDRPLIAIPAALVIGAGAGFVDHLIRDIIEWIHWSAWAGM